MGFSVGSYAKIKEVEDKGKYSKAKIVISRRNPDNSSQYVCTYAGWVTMVGRAHQNRPMANQKIKITNCDITNGYIDRTGMQRFSNAPQCTIYDYELQSDLQSNAGGYIPNAYGGNNSVANGFEDILPDSSLPF